jgi:hypothetical protein
MCYQPNSHELTYSPETAGAFGRRLRRKFKKVGIVLKKAHTVPFRAIHKVTHGKRSPIRKLEEKLQGIVGKALPFTKPFIAAHNKVSNQTYKVLEKTGVIKKGDTKRIGNTSTNIAAVASAAQGLSGSPQGAAARLAATLKSGKNVLPQAELKALRTNKAFRAQALKHLAVHASSGNKTAADALRRLAGQAA